MPRPIEPTRIGFSPQTQERVQGQLVRNQARFTENLTQVGTQLYQNRPGRVFNLGNSGYYYSAGTAADGSYIPSFNYSNGGFTHVGLRPISEARIPTNPRAHSGLAIRQLDLKDNGDGNYSRNGFVGSYTVREDGGIQFSGGHHQSNRNITFQPQVYYNGYWYSLGQEGALPTQAPRRQTQAGGFGGGRTSSRSACPPGVECSPQGPVRADTYTPRSDVSLPTGIVRQGDSFTRRQGTTSGSSGARRQTTTSDTFSQTSVSRNTSRISVRFGQGQNANTLSSVEGSNLFVTRGSNWYSVMDSDEQYPYTLSNESRGRIHYLVPGEHGHFPGVVPVDDGSGHPPELQPLIQSVRRYYQESQSYAASARGQRPGGRLPSRSGIPRGFPLTPGGGEMRLSTVPNYAFINRTDSQGRSGVYYRHVDEPPTFWRSMTTDGNIWFREQGGRMVEVDREGRQVAVSGQFSVPQETRRQGPSGVIGTPPAATIEDIPARAGDAVGYSPREGQRPFRTETFNTDLTRLRFQVRRNARNVNVEVPFKPQSGTSRDWLDNRVSAQQDLRDAGIRVVPRFARQTHQGARGPHQTETLIGYTIEFYQPGNYQASIRQNYATWYFLDGQARSANSSQYPTEDIPLTVER